MSRAVDELQGAARREVGLPGESFGVEHDRRVIARIVNATVTVVERSDGRR
jgi:hypothetical protein